MGERTQHGGARTRSGFTLVEVMVALALVAFALMGFSRSLVSTMVASETDREVRAATEAARAVMERLSGASFTDVFALYNADPSDDPGGPGTAPGPGVDLPGLAPLENDPDGRVGEILLPVLDNGGNLEVREDLNAPWLGMPRDLNGDGLIDALDHSADYIVLPVVVRFEWQGSGGPARIEFHTLLTGV